MKRVATLLLSVMLLMATVVPTPGQTRNRSRFGRKARTAAIIAGGAALGVLTGGLSVAAMGAGGAGLFASTGAQLAGISNPKPVPWALFSAERH